MTLIEKVVPVIFRHVDQNIFNATEPKILIIHNYFKSPCHYLYYYF